MSAVNQIKAEYTLIADLTEQEANDLDEFLGCSVNYSGNMIQIVKNRGETVERLHRGIKYRRKDLRIGQTYKHWDELSSWSTNEEVAIGFAVHNDIPDGLLDDVFEEWGHNPYTMNDPNILNKVFEEFIDVVLVVENGFGFVVNKHLLHNQFAKEEEVIVHDGKWLITDIQEKAHKKGEVYYEVRLSAQSETVQ